MTQSPESTIVLAAAGSAKTQMILDRVLANPDRTALITTYTTENLDQITRRLQEANNGAVPQHVTVMTWFSLLVNHAIRPYQRSVFGESNFIAAFNFLGARNRFVPKNEPARYFLDANRDVYRNGAADLACEVETRSGGLVCQRLAEMFDDIYIDELQDLAGYDLTFLELLLRSKATVIGVGDSRQQTFVTNDSRKNKKFKGDGLVAWVQARADCCTVEFRNECYRSNQEICDFADGIFPSQPKTISKNETVTGHDGIFRIARDDVAAYYEQYGPVVLRYRRDVDTLGLPAKNFGVAKGSTYDRTLIFCTNPMLKYLRDGDVTTLTSKEKFYVAVTRARYSVAFVID